MSPHNSQFPSRVWLTLAFGASLAAGLKAQEQRTSLNQVRVAQEDAAASAPSIRAQLNEHPPKHIVSIGVGAAVPSAGLQPYMSSAFLLRVGYAWRFHRYFQVETGADAVFSSARIDRWEPSAVGNVNITDTEYFLPFGASAVLPLNRGRFEFTSGGGGAYLNYGEEASRPDSNCYTGTCYIYVPCPFCKSRGGWGYYGAAGAAFALNSRRRAWLDFTYRYFRATTSGQALGSVPSTRTQDQWLTITVGLSGRF